MAWASVGGGATTTGGPTPLSRSGPVLRFVLPRQRFVPRSHGTEKAPAICWPGQVKQSGIGGYSALPALHQLRRDCRAEPFFVALPTSKDLFTSAKDLFLEATDGKGPTDYGHDALGSISKPRSQAHAKSHRLGGDHDLVLILARDSEEQTVGRARTKSGQ